jgi:hypothetical protein
MCAITGTRADSGGSGTGIGSGGYWPQLLESWQAQVVTPEPRQKPGLEPARPTPACVLAMAPLHQSAAFVLTYQRGRGRHGLPPEAVRNLARQALVALDELHT